MSKLEVSIPISDEYFNFDVAGLGDKLEAAYLELGYKNTGKAKISFAPSSLGYGSGRCARNWYYKLTGGIEQKDDVDALQISNMENGTETHARIQRIFEISGTLIEAERELNTMEDKALPPIRGFVDLIVDWNGEAVGEIKTTKQEAFTLRKAEGKPLDYHVIQLLIYMRILGINRGFILYENKNTGEWLIFPVMMTPENERIIEEAFEWMRVTYQSYQEEQLPMRPFEKSSKECLYCPFKKFCWKDEAGVNPLPILQIT